MAGGANSTITLNCGITGQGISNIRWYIQRPGAVTSEAVASCSKCMENYDVVDDIELRIVGVQASNEGVYHCQYTQLSQMRRGPQTNVTVLGKDVIIVSVICLYLDHRHYE